MFDNLRRWWKSGKSSKRPARKNPLRQWSFRPMLEALEPRWVPSAPTVTGVTPNSGSTAAATPVVIDGTGFSTATAVYFGSTQVEFDAPSGSDTVIDAYSPSSAAAGTVDVTVVNPDGTSATSSADQFTFVAPPVITSISPAGGPTTGDTQVLITGNGFTAATGVTFNSNLPASYEVLSDTEILATSPAYSYNYDVPVQVTTPYGTSPQGNGSYFQYASPTAPTVTSISSSTGPTGGGTEVEIDGSNFTNATAVDFGAVPALNHVIDADNIILAWSPPQPTGATDITVTTSNGTSATSSADKFTYVPSVTAVTPASGPTGGGAAVVIDGSGFTDATAVHFGSIEAADFTVESDTVIDATAPAGSAGTVDITVATSSGTSATWSADQYTYMAPPAVTSISPAGGPTTGDTLVLISGSGFTGATAVDFNGVPAASFDVLSDTEVQTASPAADATGVVDITVTTPYGTSATSSADQFTYAAAAAPAVTSVAPRSGVTAGGADVVIDGAGFTGATAVDFGGVPATSYTVVADNVIDAVSPAGALGAVDITVTTPLGTSATSSADQFIYAPPTTTTLSSSENPATYGDDVALTATVSPNSDSEYTPTGTVTFMDGSTVLGTATLSFVGGSEQATFYTSSLAIGNHSLTAVYGGNANFAGSVSLAFNLAVNPIMVTNLNNGGAGSLRAAITAANAAGGNPEIDFQAGLTGTITLASALPDLSANIKLVGPGAGTIAVARDPNAATTFRIFTVDANTTCTISGLAITGGVPGGVGAAADGGGVYNEGNLTLSADNLYLNKANNAGDGGAICNARTGTLTVSSCQIYANSAAFTGGGIFNDGALSIIGDSSLANNAALVGAGIYNNGFGKAVIGGTTTIDENTATQHGGGVANFGSFTMDGGRIDSNTVTGNAVAQQGGGYYGSGAGATATLTGVDLSSDSAGKGGGFYLDGPTTLSLGGCTISNNSAATGIGGYYNPVATYTPTNCTIANTDTIVKGP